MKAIYLTEKEFNVIKCTGDIDYLECLEGVLLDNELIEINNVMYAAYEYPLKANSSDLLVYIATNKRENEILISQFEQFKKEYINDRVWNYIYYSRYAIDNNLKRDVNTGEKVYNSLIVSRCMETLYSDCIESLEYYCDKDQAKQYIKEYITNNESRYY